MNEAESLKFASEILDRIAKNNWREDQVWALEFSALVLRAYIEKNYMEGQDNANANAYRD